MTRDGDRGARGPGADIAAAFAQRPRLALRTAVAGTRTLAGLFVLVMASASPARAQTTDPRPGAPAVSTGSGSAAALATAADCARLTGTVVPAARIGLPSGEARVDYAAPVDALAAGASMRPDRTPAPALPAYCRVLGHIAPVNPAAPPIRFRLNLPLAWNGRALQFGGSGFNGALVDGLGEVPSAPLDVPPPLARGYATYGTDSGHATQPGQPPQAFALDDEAFVNFAYASYKKVRDVAGVLIAAHYGRAASRFYYVGSSEGGREGLAMAQRFPADFDGVFARVPVIAWTGLMVAHNRVGVALDGGGWLNSAKIALVERATLAACDAADGLADGIVSRYEGCGSRFAALALRCPGGRDAGDHCLSDAQVLAINTLREPVEFPSPLAHGVTVYPGFGHGGEAGPGGWPRWWTGPHPPHHPARADDSRQWWYGSGTVRYVFARNPEHDSRNFHPRHYAPRLQQVSALMDATDPDLSAFHARGGKLVVLEHTSDYAQSFQAGVQYWKTVEARLGAATVERFARLYVTPGADHAGDGVPKGVDMLAVLENWVERGVAPGDLAQVAQEPAPPHAVTRSRPLCRYPTYPRHRGGDSNLAASFRCEPL